MVAPLDLTETGMANGALELIGEPPIATLDDPKRAAARACKAAFAAARDELLREEPWQFAKMSCTPAAQPTQPNPSYKYRYLMPPDCIAVRSIDREDDPNWEVEASGDDTTLPLALDTNRVAPLVWYTRRIVNPAQWDPLFAAVFKLRLAARVNPRIGRDKSLTGSLLELAETKLSEAKLRDSQERSRDRIRRDTSWVMSRYGVGIAR